MSSIPPFRPPAELEAEVLKENQRAIEAKAARYAQLHDDEEDRARSTGAVRRALRRIRRAVGRRS